MSARVLLAAAASWLMAGLWRLRCLDQVSISSDSLGAFLAAWAARPGHLPMPPNPEAGFSLWVTAWPLVQMATSLEQLFALRFWQASLIAPLTLLATHRLTRDLRAAGCAAALVALDSGLVDTLVSSFRGYGAPELLALASLALAWTLPGRAVWLLLLPLILIAASGQHPFATGAALGGLAALPWLLRAHHPRVLLLALVLGVLCCLPRLWWIQTMADCPGGSPLSCLSTIAWGSSEGALSRPQLLWRALLDRSTETSGATLLLLAGVAAALWHRRPSGAWAIGVLLGIILLGLSVQSLRPYHLRIAAAPLALAAAVGWLRMGRVGWAAALLAVLLTATAPLPLGTPGALRQHDTLGRMLADEAPAWVDAAWAEGPIQASPAGVALSAVLQGAPAADLRPAPQRPVLILVSGLQHEDALFNGENGYVLHFSSLSAAQYWIDSTPSLQGAGVARDWLAALFPGEPLPPLLTFGGDQ